MTSAEGSHCGHHATPRLRAYQTPNLCHLTERHLPTDWRGKVSPMTDAMTGPLRQYLQEGRDAMLRALDGLGEYDARRPLTPSGTNILGLVKHLVGVERSYLGECVGRTPGFSLPWEEDGSIWEGADMWLRADESRECVVGLYHQAWQHSDASIKELPLDTEAYVHWWKEGKRCPSFGSLITRVVAETAQHAGHAEILREGLDGQGGRDHGSLDAAAWTEYVARIQEVADTFRNPPDRAAP